MINVIRGKLVHAGTFPIHDEEVTGLVISVPRAELEAIEKLPLMRTVDVVDVSLRSQDDIIMGQEDLNLCLGSQELKPCPFCGHHAMSSGERTPNGRAIMWSIRCMGSEGLMPNCMASVTGTHPDQATARKMAVERWNKRTPVPELAGTLPVTLYFGSDADRDEFIAAVREIKPGLVAKKI